jgi:hypothetical protein
MVSFKLSLVKFMALLAMSGTATAALSETCKTDTENLGLTGYNTAVTTLIVVAGTAEFCKGSNGDKHITCDYRDAVSTLETECKNFGGEPLFFTQVVKCDDDNKVTIKAFPECVAKSCTEADKEFAIKSQGDSFIPSLETALETKDCKSTVALCTDAKTCDVKSGATASLGGIAVMMAATASLAFLAAI